MEIDYSVIIRTTGKAGEKYRTLLNSINNLDPQPKEIIVVLPNGYDLPKEKLGWETFYFCEKGMVRQRLTGIDNCRTKYALITDDDISFEKDFVKKLYIGLGNKYGFSAGPLVDFFPKKGKQSFISIVTGNAVPTIFHKNRYNSVLRTAGYSYNRTINPKKNYETQSAPWTCFFMDVDQFNIINFKDEMWLDKNGYSAKDDQCMFYKAWLNGIKTIIVGDAFYQHLDARTSTIGNHVTSNFATGFNLIVFWHRYIYSQEKFYFFKIIDKICLYYHYFGTILFNRINLIRNKMTKEEYNAFKKGYSKGKQWIKTKEYKLLKSVRKINEEICNEK